MLRILSDSDFDQLGEASDDCVQLPGFQKKDISETGGQMKGRLGREAGALGGK